MTYYIKDNIRKFANEIVIYTEDYQIINPTEKEILADGWIKVDDIKPDKLEQAKLNKIDEIDSYDVSDNVNSFTFKGVKMWFSKADRIGLKNSMSIEKSNGKTTSTMWFNDMPLEVNIDEGLKLLDKIEMYALDCYNVTAKHKADVNKLNTIEEIESYKIDKDYPNKLTIN